MAAKNDILIDKDGNQIFPATTAEQVSYDGNINVKQAIKRGAVRNKVAPTVASMTDKEQIYVYTGTELVPDASVYEFHSQIIMKNSLLL